MSHVRMCDGCGNIFKEGVLGSSFGTGQEIVSDGRGGTRPITRQMDICPSCTNPQKRRAITTAPIVQAPVEVEEVEEVDKDDEDFFDCTTCGKETDYDTRRRVCVECADILDRWAAR